MTEKITHLYFMPGMAAKPTIFERLELDASLFEVHWLHWIPPKSNEPLTLYAKRMAKFITQDNAVLIGVSFGGILVQEMDRFLKLKKIIIISSVKSHDELPNRLKWVKAMKAYRLVPNTTFNPIHVLSKFAFNKALAKRVNLYETYMELPSKTYLNWAIREVVKWQAPTLKTPLLHIHGTQDAVFPIQYIKNCIPIQDGTHIMILNRFKWFNTHLPKLIVG